MNKIIRVTGCHDCPVVGHSQDPTDPLKGQMECMHDSVEVETIVTEYILNSDITGGKVSHGIKLLPADCPLEDDK